ncbi:MAG: V-type ATP synthase subunit I, partial [Planctomycetota bacterium]
MALSRMVKIIIATHRSEATEVLEALQDAGIVQILDAERAMVSKDWPELKVDIQRPRNIEEMVGRLDKSIAFLSAHATDKGQGTMFQPLAVVDADRYSRVVGGKEALDLLDEAEDVAERIDRVNAEYENSQGTFEALYPWRDFSTPVNEIGDLETTACITGLIGLQHFDEVAAKLEELGAALQQVGGTSNAKACLIVCMNESVGEVQKALRSGDFDAVSFEKMEGTVSELLENCEEDIARIGVELGDADRRAAELATERLTLQILYDHYRNLLSREQTRAAAPATEQTILIEGWVKTRDYDKLGAIVDRFAATSIGEMDVAEDEEVPVEIENNKAIRPFETITRLYGMPNKLDVDPTVFLAPFFAIFFGLCMTDAAYGIVMIAFMWWLIKKIKGEKNFMWMMVICSITTVIAGALTGGWFGDAIQNFFGEDSGINKLRTSLMWFDPLEKPMYFFTISLALGYLQIIFGVAISFVHKFRMKDYTSAVFDHLSWLIWLNSLLIFGLAKGGILPAALGPIFMVVAIIPAVTILLFSERQGGWGNRIGMGFYNVFSTVFYVGDVLSYIRLMALGMVTGGFGMAINEICKSLIPPEGASFVVSALGYIGAGVIFIGGHLFNIANSA